MERHYFDSPYCSATKFIEDNEQLLKRHESSINMSLDVKDGDVLQFLDDDFNVPTLFQVNKGQSKSSSYTIIAYCNDVKIQIPVCCLFDGEKEDITLTNEYDALCRTKLFLGGAWKAKRVKVKPKDWSFNVEVLRLTPASDTDRLKWELKKHEIQMNIEIDVSISQIKSRYNRMRQANTKKEIIKLRSRAEFQHTSSRFSWGEGYQEKDVYKVTTEYVERTYYKDLLLSEERYTKDYIETD